VHAVAALALVLGGWCTFAHASPAWHAHVLLISPCALTTPLPPPSFPPPTAGFTPEERASFADNLLGSCGLVDAFRAQYPEAVGYTYWSYRWVGRVRGRGNVQEGWQERAGNTGRRCMPQA